MIFAIVFAFAALDSLPPPTLLAPGKRADTLWRTPVKRLLPALGLSFVAGASWGLHETLQHHWPTFERKHPGANPQWWNPDQSWLNKYQNRDPNQGRTGVPVQLTDAKHLLVLVHNTTLFSAGVSIGIWHRRKWWRYAVDAGAALLSYSAGNLLTYNMYRPP